MASYLAEDVDPITQNNIGKTAIIYLNPECQDNISECNVGQVNGQYSFIVSSYFDFTQSTASVNAQLNAQQSTVDAGTYKYVRLEFCKDGTGGVPNISFECPGMTSRYSYARDNCGVTVEANPPLQINANSTVQINLTYDLTNLVTVDSGDVGNHCTEQDGHTYCMNFPNFIPSASII